MLDSLGGFEVAMKGYILRGGQNNKYVWAGD